MTPGRLIGLDVARCLALLGMIATHMLAARDSDGTLTAAQWLAGGRASALFAVLAGVTIALGTGGETPVGGRDRLCRSGGLVVRALLVAVVGLGLAELDSGLAIILVYYALLFVLALPFLGLRAPILLGLAATWVVVVPVVSHLVRPDLSPRSFDVPGFEHLTDLGPLLADLVLTGYYPALPWLAYLLLGLGVGRLDLRRAGVQVSLVASGLALAVVAMVVSRRMTAVSSLTPRQLDEAATGMYGTTPTDGPADWLLVVAPHSGTGFDLAQTGGSALLVIGLCLLVVDRLPEFAHEVVRVLFGAGTMTLTLYSLHVWLRTEVWDEEGIDHFMLHALTVVMVGSVFAGLRWRGPLEAAVGQAAGLVSGRR